MMIGVNVVRIVTVLSEETIFVKVDGLRTTTTLMTIFHTGPLCHMKLKYPIKERKMMPHHVRFVSSNFLWVNKLT